MRPASHRNQVPGRSCGNCAFSKLVACKLDLLCFHGDTIEILGHDKYPIDADNVFLNGNEVGMMDGDEYDRVWSSRIVDPDDVCDEWKGESDGTQTKAESPRP